MKRLILTLIAGLLCVPAFGAIDSKARSAIHDIQVGENNVNQILTLRVRDGGIVGGGLYVSGRITNEQIKCSGDAEIDGDLTGPSSISGAWMASEAATYNIGAASTTQTLTTGYAILNPTGALAIATVYLSAPTGNGDCLTVINISTSLVEFVDGGTLAITAAGVTNSQYGITEFIGYKGAVTQWIEKATFNP